MGPGLRRDDTCNCGGILSNTLQNITGTIALAGAGKMGGAMLTGWLAGGLDAKRVVVIEPYPSDEIKAFAKPTPFPHVRCRPGLDLRCAIAHRGTHTPCSQGLSKLLVACPSLH